jgi:hypothetical protein
MHPLISTSANLAQTGSPPPLESSVLGISVACVRGD